jgi:hypothetical protein
VPVVSVFVAPVPISVLILAAQFGVVTILSMVLGEILMIVAVLIRIPVVIILVGAIVYTFLIIVMLILRRRPADYSRGCA